ncbi:uncharacterized protein LOC122576267 [Bombus pyrosoma]|uniref:uncharacterized protein LOC122576267 n=1 Tax=Bombus pyrosoma TaxID=396416 RepID=UPI001CB8A735|nr:uncharacterized protein LOC122576267 [Bombus pyrosoma]
MYNICRSVVASRRYTLTGSAYKQQLEAWLPSVHSRHATKEDRCWRLCASDVSLVQDTRQDDRNCLKLSPFARICVWNDNIPRKLDQLEYYCHRMADESFIYCCIILFFGKLVVGQVDYVEYFLATQ